MVVDLLKTSEVFFPRMLVQASQHQKSKASTVLPNYIIKINHT